MLRFAVYQSIRFNLKYAGTFSMEADNKKPVVAMQTTKDFNKQVNYSCYILTITNSKVKIFSA